MVDVLLNTADNIFVTDMARLQRHPPVEELGEVDDKYVIGTAEILLFPQMRYDVQSKKYERKSNG